MPYRRLPKTDQARLRTLRSITELEYYFKVPELPVELRLMSRATALLSEFTDAVRQYQQSYALIVEESKKYQRYIVTARLYVSHFIQVLNMTIQRRELKPDVKTLYGLDPNSSLLPDLHDEQQLIKWGDSILKGEAQRTFAGGAPLQNPSAARMRVHYDIFVESYNNLEQKQKIFNKMQQQVQELRPKIDDLMKQCWDSIESKFADLPPYSRLKQCERCGIVYYYRKGEKTLTPEDDLVDQSLS